MYAVKINGTSVRIVVTVPRYQLSYSEHLTIDKILYNDDPESLGSQDIGEKQFHVLHLPPASLFSVVLAEQYQLLYIQD